MQVKKKKKKAGPKLTLDQDKPQSRASEVICMTWDG